MSGPAPSNDARGGATQNQSDATTASSTFASTSVPVPVQLPITGRSEETAGSSTIERKHQQEDSAIGDSSSAGGDDPASMVSLPSTTSVTTPTTSSTIRHCIPSTSNTDQPQYHHQSTSTSQQISSQKATTSMTTATAPLTLTSSVISTAGLAGGRLRLDILLANGQRKYFDFRLDTMVQEVREEIWKTWPDDWPTRPASSTALRLLHLGHILPDSTILGPAPASSTTSPTNGKTSNTTTPLSFTNNKENKKSSSSSPSTPQYRGLPPGRTTVVHLLIKGGWMSDEERIQEEERERLKSQRGDSKQSRGTGKGGASPPGGGTGQGGTNGINDDEGRHGNSDGCCCVIC